MACKPDPSVVSFLPGLALMKTTVLESMRTLSYFRLDTLPKVVYILSEEWTSGGRALHSQLCRACQLSSGKNSILHNWVNKSALTSTPLSFLSFAALSVIFSTGSWTSPLVE